ncbi:MAG TPA: N-acetylglucosamine-6-phosphate deacetylase [Verrucomicrobiae bacterium]|nr:N-acetylglucosamine-6-phosphate deacetylase [Verrucomicrobiae bacterium]
MSPLTNKGGDKQISDNLARENPIIRACLGDKVPPYCAGMIVIINGRVVGPHGVLENHCVVVEGGKIKQVAPTSQVLWPEDAKVIDAHESFVAPGFVDMHVHGALGRDTMDGSIESLAQIAKFHASGGTTAMTPTTTTHSAERIGAALDAISKAMGHDFGGAQILGAHIEGPYISQERGGAQPSEFIHKPNPVEYGQWLDRDGLITQMTLAPELPGAFELIDALLEREILPSGGHTAASYEQARAAVDRGLCHATHAFNCMSSTTKSGAFRSPGALETFLADDRVMLELIADGKHVHPGLMRLAVRAKGVDKICLVTDATAGAGLTEGAEFMVSETRAVVRDGVGMIADGSALAGSVSTLIQMVKNMVELAGVSLADAVRMASLNPSRALGINSHKGSIEPRKDADMVIFSGGFAVEKTLVGGRVEYEAKTA